MNLPTLTVLINGTDVTAYVLLVNGYSLSRGRADWQGAVTAGELSLTLNNSDGRFTPGAAVGGGGFDTLPFGSGAFGGGASSVAVDASIQLKETVNGVTYTRFTGYVKSWPVSWPATVSTFSTVNVTATDAQARAERRTLRSLLEEEILLRSPSAYYTLAEATGSTAAGDSSSNQAAPLTIAGTGAALMFGTGVAPGPDGLTAAQFFGGQVLAGTSGGGYIGATANWSIGFEILVPSTPATFPYALWLDDGSAAGANTLKVIINTLGKVSCSPLCGGAGVGSVASSNICDGRTHHVAITSNGTTLALYVDGVSVSTSVGGAFTAPLTRLSLGGGLPGAAAPSTTLTATMSHATVWPTTLTAGQVQAIYNAGSGGAETTGARVTRLAAYANLTVGTVDTTTTLVPAQPTNGSGAMEAIQAVSDAELGLVYIDGTGALTFHNRNRVVAKTVPDLTLDHQWVTPDVQPTVDDQQILNYFEATAQGTGGTTVVRNAASDTAHGRYPTSQTYLVQTDQEAIDRANWIVANFAEPSARYGTLTINLAGMTQAQASTVLAAVDLDCWLRLTSMGSQTPGGTTVDVIVEGFQETVSADTWTLACNVASRSLYAPVWRLDTSSLDTDTRLYV